MEFLSILALFVIEANFLIVFVLGSPYRQVKDTLENAMDVHFSDFIFTDSFQTLQRKKNLESAFSDKHHRNLWLIWH